MSKTQGNLCKNCKHRFRRVFIPLDVEEYEDMDGNPAPLGEGTIFISNQCLVMNMDIDKEATVECSHFTQLERKGHNDFPFSSHIK